MKKSIFLTFSLVIACGWLFAQSSSGTSNAVNLGPLLEQAFKEKEAAKIVLQEEEEKAPDPIPDDGGGVKVELIADIDKDIPETGMVNPNGFAVIIGNANYSHTADVNYAINDALAMEMYVKKTLGFPDENVFVIKDATLRDFRLWFGDERRQGRLNNLVFQNDETISDVFVFFAGHGAPDVNTSTGYFLPTDCEPDYIDVTSYSGELLFSNLGKIGSRSTTVVLDACFSGNGVITGLSAVAIKPKSFGAIPNGVILSSSTGTEPSAWYEEQNHGMFSYFFMKAIQDNQTSDTNMDGQLSIQEIYDYASNKVTRRARGSRNLDQHPTIQGTERDRVLVSFQ